MTILGPLGPSLAPVVRRNRSLYRLIKPFADWYADFSGYRKVGYKYDDLIPEERDDVQKALSRLTPREAYDRQYRLKRASQCSVLHDVLPKDQWTKPSEDVRYLAPIVEAVENDELERKAWDSMVPVKK
ncbi:ubiquinol-cytochrome-c reductase complex subunit 6 [Laetiporus sulphureus 93-53]|uniref:Complex III subunit 7 n=1 Tax=Laetiporus sulphureus 93-53 TaxID=1314785 RepID=A0A165HBA3_9APHY|nr:ubiquinol-cytochrome-c reductase complex subunit 6 [Laetiporus sulphureus 93-53]KZT11499.1 ubiquinol-cytochrome-c reductase complex subunit 6 [Laetiporus sulphureus 93-53]